MTISIRRVCSWKFSFYRLLLPALRRLGPARGDRALGMLGMAFALAWPGRRSRLKRALAGARGALSLDDGRAWDWLGFAAGTARFLGRDYLLDLPEDGAFHERFEVHGLDHFRAAAGAGRGVMLVGSHFGAHLAGLHWLFRSGIPVNALVQRPTHISAALSKLIDARLAAGPGNDLFLRRKLQPAEAAELLLRARSALRRGELVYACGDIPWEGPNCRSGRLLGRGHRFLSIWTDLAVLTRAPTLHVFCSHLPGGKFRLEFVPAGPVRPGEEALAVENYLRNLEARIGETPTQAVAHLLWPCFSPTVADRPGARLRRHGHSGLTGQKATPRAVRPGTRRLDHGQGR